MRTPAFVLVAFLVGTLVVSGQPMITSTEGPDDMPAHIKAILTSTSLSIPVLDGRLVLGTWQGIICGSIAGGSSVQ